ncbi:MAG TPA: DMP19 family protein [Planctomycetota bacterium]|nr:DMP19 family protein [Planctomycetota bacterium]
MDKNTFLIGLSESSRTMYGRVDFDHQPPEQQVFSAIWELESQVNNGGFAQLFSAVEGHSASRTPQALMAIGAEACADIVERALRVLSPDPLPREQSLREEMVEQLGPDAQEALEALDQEFLAYPDNLTDLLHDYVRAHPDVFGPVEP